MHLVKASTRRRVLRRTVRTVAAHCFGPRLDRQLSVRWRELGDRQPPRRYLPPGRSLSLFVSRKRSLHLESRCLGTGCNSPARGNRRTRRSESTRPETLLRNPTDPRTGIRRPSSNSKTGFQSVLSVSQMSQALINPEYGETRTEATSSAGKVTDRSQDRTVTTPPETRIPSSKDRPATTQRGIRIEAMRGASPIVGSFNITMTDERTAHAKDPMRTKYAG